MSYSNLAAAKYAADISNYTQGRRGYKICKFTPHHMAGILTAKQCGAIFERASRNASSNYGIGNDGTIACYVDEENRAWTSSSPVNDCQAITVEVSDCEIGGQWRISDAAWKSLVNLAVDVCKRYNFRLSYDGTPNGSLTTHDMFANTNCPGPYLKSRMNELAATVNAILDGGSVAPAQPKPVTTTTYRVGEKVTINGIYTASNSTKKLSPARNTGTITKVIPGAYNPYLLDNGNLGWTNDNCIIKEQSSETPAPAAKSITTLAQEVLNGQWGNGVDRKNRLQAAGYNYNEVQAEVNRLVSGKSAAPAKKSNETIADEVIAGKWGNGADRKNKLIAAGYDYSAIQKIVNQKLR